MAANINSSSTIRSSACYESIKPVVLHTVAVQFLEVSDAKGPGFWNLHPPCACHVYMAPRMSLFDHHGDYSLTN